MSEVLPLDWAVIALSLFNTILLFWLGLTILLTAERREWGVWFVGAGALTGAGFFVSHTVLLGVGWVNFSPAVDFWWRAGMLPLVLCPWLWYVALLWYAGLWDEGNRALRRVHRPGLLLVSLTALVLLLAVLLEDPARQIPRLLSLDLSLTGRLLLLYPFYTIGCTGLALHALRRPGSELLPARAAARRKAQPWLVLSTLILLVVSLLVAGALLWILENSLRRGLDSQLTVSILLIDVFIAALIALSVLLMGQAVVTYEIFSSRSLPRASLRRQWQRVILLSAGYSLVIGGVFALQFPPVYGLLLTALLMTAFFALLGWRTLAERRALLDVLRPFVSGEKMYPAIIAPQGAGINLQAPFSALCSEVLNCRYALLAPVGAFRTLLRQDLLYPPDHDLEAPARSSAPGVDEYLPLAEQTGGFYHWGVPLFNEAGLTGFLYLGPKVGETLYVQEELELAQAACERLVDMQASATLSRYLLELQRQELAETAILDRRSRRVLHDEILPQLHTLILEAQRQSDPDLITGLAGLHSQLSDLLHSMPPTSSPQFQKIGVLAALRQVVEGEFAEAFASVDWQIQPQAQACLQELPPLNQEVLYYAARELVRNAARHARQGAGHPLALSIELSLNGELELAIQDNGPGLPDGGADSAPASSGGYGLGLHAAMLAVLGGSLALENQTGLTARLRLPVADN